MSLHVADRLLRRAVDHDRRAVRDGGERDDRRALSDRLCHRQRVAASVQRASGDDLLNRDRRALAGQDRHVEAFFGEVTAGLGVQRRRITDQIIQRRDEIDLHATAAPSATKEMRRAPTNALPAASRCRREIAGMIGRSFLNSSITISRNVCCATCGQSHDAMSSSTAPDIRFAGVEKRFTTDERTVLAVDRTDLFDPRRRVSRAARSVRLRQNDHASHDRGAHSSERRYDQHRFERSLAR